MRMGSVGLDQGDDLPIATSYILVEDSDDAFSTDGLEQAGDGKQDSIQHSIRECDVPVAKLLFLESKGLGKSD